MYSFHVKREEGLVEPETLHDFSIDFTGIALGREPEEIQKIFTESKYMVSTGIKK